MSNILNVDDSNFDVEVLNSNLPVLVEFGAAWCGPCQRQLPVLEKLAEEYSNKLKVVKLDIDDSPTVTSKYGIRSVPTLVLFKDGVKLEIKVGLTSQAILKQLLSDKLDF